MFIYEFEILTGRGEFMIKGVSSVKLSQELDTLFPRKYKGNNSEKGSSEKSQSESKSFFKSFMDIIK